MDRRVAGLLAAAAAAQQVVTPLRDFTVSCPATYVWDDETLSGGGHLFEYYHFLIDFAPRVLEAFEANGEECEDITILAPQKLSGGKRVFLVELNEAASMRAQLAAVFEPQHRITVELWQGHGKDPLPEVLDVAGYPAPFDRAIDVLIVRRGKPTGDAEGWLTGYDRRHLDAGFFADAERALRDEPSVLGNFRVVELEREPLPQQARLFASARVVIGAHGAGLSNAVFCAPGTLVVEIGKAPCKAWFPCFATLAKVVGLRFAHVEAAKTLTGPVLDLVVSHLTGRPPPPGAFEPEPEAARARRAAAAPPPKKKTDDEIHAVVVAGDLGDWGAATAAIAAFRSWQSGFGARTLASGVAAADLDALYRKALLANEGPLASRDAFGTTDGKGSLAHFRARATATRREVVLRRRRPRVHPRLLRDLARSLERYGDPRTTRVRVGHTIFPHAAKRPVFASRAGFFASRAAVDAVDWSRALRAAAACEPVPGVPEPLGGLPADLKLEAIFASKSVSKFRSFATDFARTRDANFSARVGPYRGVFRVAAADGTVAYRAKIAEKGRLVDVGGFASEVEAARAHDAAAVAAGKAPKRLNFGAVRGEVAVHVGSLGLSSHRHEARPMGMAVWHAHLPAKRLGTSASSGTTRRRASTARRASRRR
ncbi:hypothetical protein JL722_4597 [Aureococcus anophagefferens]|nr:hypothetical protein JL722_4597 [Aureococcus anophagefferens]